MGERKLERGTVEAYENRYYRVRHGLGLTDVAFLRSQDFILPQDRKVEIGMEVTLYYVTGPGYGLLKAKLA
jgi:hypothetical protein